MRVLVACEFSGVVRRAFRERGLDAWSCDLLPSEDDSEYHIRGDAYAATCLCAPWDLLIAHPPCTFLTVAGARWLYKGGRGRERDEKRWDGLKQAAAFFRSLLHSKIPRICIENPIPMSYANLPPFTQKIQPWQFGHGETKATCLWLHNLPKLIPTDIVEGRTPRVHHASPRPDRWKERSRTLPGIAAAMADQWSNPLPPKAE